MKFDFEGVQETISLRSVPAGEHVCMIREVREGLSRDGSPRWSMRLEVAEGEHAGHHAAWDSITWSERGIFRVRAVLDVLGFKVAGELEVNPEDLEGKRGKVRLVEEVYEDPSSGTRREQMVVPYNGWAALDGELEGGSAEKSQGEQAPSPSSDGEIDPF
jgi:hypothetical protein